MKSTTVTTAAMISALTASPAPARSRPSGTVLAKVAQVTTLARMRTTTMIVSTRAVMTLTMSRGVESMRRA